MTRLEVIRVRSATPCSVAMLKALEPILAEARGQVGVVGCRVYVHCQIQGDLAVHVVWKGDGPDSGVVGRLLTECLQRVGLVDHAIWKQVL